jgi:multidrug resistance efflux pump
MMTEPTEWYEMLDVEKAWAENFAVEAGRPPDAGERINFLRSVALEHQQEADTAEDRAGPEGGHLEEARGNIRYAEECQARGGETVTTRVQTHAMLAQAHAAIALAERV